MKYYLLILLIFSICFSCKKADLETTNNSNTLHFSTDTISFDTIFASIGSITKTLKVYNHNNTSLTTNINLRGSSIANFRININGTAGNNQNNIEIPSNDSIFIFIEVTIDPSLNTTPYILSDSLVFTTGTKEQAVNLVAWGQDAYFHTADTFGLIVSGNDTTKFFYHQLDCNENWNNDKPHVIYGYAIVDPNCILTINKGCNVYLHKNSGIIVGNPFSQSPGGTIKINGELGNEVVFQGDRLDPWYTQSPKPAGQWDRIWLTPGSINNEINYAIIKNGNIGIHADTVYNSNPTLKINNTIIENMSGIGILGQGAHITANNLVIKECGQYAVACNIGGTYNFTHCTFANYWNQNNRNTPSVLLNNYYEGINGEIYPRDLDSANFINCIIDGYLTTEISFQKNQNKAFNYNFNHCLIKLDPSIETDNTFYTNTIINQSPKFVSNDDLHLKEESPAVNNGNQLSEGSLDIEGKSRDNPDIGAYELD